MTTAFVTDLHIGRADNEDEAYNLLNDVSEALDERGVERVVLLGDVIHEDDPATDISRLERVRGMLDTFELYATAGNHDIIELSAQEYYGALGTSPNITLRQTEDSATVLLDSAAGAAHQNMGYLGNEALGLLEQHLEQGRSVQILTHYPLQRIEQLNTVFSPYPELAFPIDKAKVDALCAENNGEIKRIICGHLHPDATTTYRGAPSGIPVTAIEPLLRFQRTPNNEIICQRNNRVDIEGLIYGL